MKREFHNDWKVKSSQDITNISVYVQITDFQNYVKQNNVTELKGETGNSSIIFENVHNCLSDIKKTTRPPQKNQ